MALNIPPPPDKRHGGQTPKVLMYKPEPRTFSEELGASSCSSLSRREQCDVQGNQIKKSKSRMAQQVPARWVSADHVQSAGWSHRELTISLTASAVSCALVHLTHK